MEENPIQPHTIETGTKNSKPIKKSDRHKYEKQVRFNPRETKILKACYEEYIAECQKTLHPIVRFNQFVADMIQLGWFTWKEKNRRR